MSFRSLKFTENSLEIHLESASNDQKPQGCPGRPGKRSLVRKNHADRQVPGERSPRPICIDWEITRLITNSSSGMRKSWSLELELTCTNHAG